MKFKNVYCADFETSGENNLRINGRVHVWLWSLVNVGNNNEQYYGTNIESFFEQIETVHATKIFFHNLRFDGSFIVWHLLYMGK